MAVGLALLGAAALVFAVFAQSSGAAEGAVPIDPANAEPDTVLAVAGDTEAGNGVQISTPIRPSDLTGLGYHPDGESLLEMRPRGKNLSANPLLRLFGGSTPEDIRYYVMPREGREGAATGALDVGASAGSTVYAPVTGTVTAIRPDPTVSDANVVEIKPDSNPNARVYVSLVQSEKGSVGVKEPVTAGMTELGTVAESASVLDPQLSDYTSDAGNHVTVSASRL